MDRDAIARRQRRKQVEDALDFERDRETALVEQLEEVVTETEGPRIDEEVFAQLDAADAAVVRQTLTGFDFVAEEDEEFSFDLEDDVEPDDPAEEIARLEGEIEDSRRRQAAFQRYLDALG
jgi:hypothetical protein